MSASAAATRTVRSGSSSKLMRGPITISWTRPASAPSEAAAAARTVCSSEEVSSMAMRAAPLGSPSVRLPRQEAASVRTSRLGSRAAMRRYGDAAAGLLMATTHRARAQAPRVLTSPCLSARTKAGNTAVGLVLPISPSASTMKRRRPGRTLASACPSRSAIAADCATARRKAESRAALCTSAFGSSRDLRTSSGPSRRK